MKALHYSLLLALLAIPAVGTAQTGSVGTVAVALTLSFTTPAAPLRDEDGKIISTAPEDKVYYNEWSVSKVNANDEPVSDENFIEYLSKIGTFKYGNKEILEELLAAEIISGTSIAGWSIVKVTPNEDIPSFFAVHKTLGIVNIDPSIVVGEFTEETGHASTSTYKFYDKTTYTADGETYKSTESDTWSSKSQVSILIDSTGMGDMALNLSGVFTSSGKLAFIKIDDMLEPVYVYGAQKLDKICGSGPIIGFDELALPSLVEGTISIGAGKAVADVSVYFDAL